MPDDDAVNAAFAVESVCTIEGSGDVINNQIELVPSNAGDACGDGNTYVVYAVGEEGPINHYINTVGVVASDGQSLDYENAETVCTFQVCFLFQM
jgi:hypothetical protein